MNRHVPLVVPALAAALLALALAAEAASGQDGGATAPSSDLRERLELRLDSLRQADGGATSAVVEGSGSARQRIERLERRLRRGDFRPRDVVRLRVRPDSSLSGSYRLGPDADLELQEIDETVVLRGHLYPEAEQAIREVLAQYFRTTPEVEVEPLTRIGVLGAVQKPGYYTVDPESSLADALMQAGGPTQDAEMEELKLRRQAAAESREQQLGGANLAEITLADLGISRGDRLFVPQRAGPGIQNSLAFQIIGVVGTLTVIATRIF